MFCSKSVLVFTKEFIFREIFVKLVIDHFFEKFRNSGEQWYWSIIITFYSVVFLLKGTTLAIFNWSGNISVMRDWFMIKRSGLINTGDKNFKSCVEIPLQPDDALVQSEFIFFYQCIIINQLKLKHTIDFLWEKFQRIPPLYMKPKSKALVVCSVTAAIFIEFCLKK